MVLQFGEGDEDVGFLVGVVEIVGGKDGAAAGNRETGVSFALAEGVGVFEFDVGRGVLEGADVPAGVEQIFFERAVAGPAAFDETDAAGAGISHYRGEGAGHLRMGIVRGSERKALEAQAGAAGEIEFDRDGFIFYEAGQAAKLVEHGGQGGGEVAVVGLATGDGNGRGRSGAFGV